MSKKLVSDLLVDYLERRGVTKLFGLCGHTVIGMLDALSRSKKIEYIGTRHEAIASTCLLYTSPWAWAWPCPASCITRTT